VIPLTQSFQLQAAVQSVISSTLSALLEPRHRPAVSETTITPDTSKPGTPDAVATPSAPPPPKSDPIVEGGTIGPVKVEIPQLQPGETKTVQIPYPNSPGNSTGISVTFTKTPTGELTGTVKRLNPDGTTTETPLPKSEFAGDLGSAIFISF
jgi:hypothetical protein